MAKRQPISAERLSAMMAAQSDLDRVRIHYCYQLGSTFVNMALMEDSIIQAMSICDRVKVTSLLGADADNWERMIDKTSTLQSSTLGNLISILSKHGVAQADLDYLRWVKKKRDFFVHRFFHEGHWPGDVDEEAIDILCRRLLALELIFLRTSERIWKIFGRANLMEYVDLGADGALMVQLDIAQQIAAAKAVHSPAPVTKDDAQSELFNDA